jgi:hypothetical protein
MLRVGIETTTPTSTALRSHRSSPQGFISTTSGTSTWPNNHKPANIIHPARQERTVHHP